MVRKLAGRAGHRRVAPCARHMRALAAQAIEHHSLLTVIPIRYNRRSVDRRVEYGRDAAKTLRRIDRATSRRIRGKIRQLARDPDSLANNVTALKGAEGLMRLRVGDWRVIYTADLVVLLVIRIAPRGGAYE